MKVNTFSSFLSSCFLIGFLLQINSSIISQTVEMCALDRENNLAVGPNIMIHSNSRGLPVVEPVITAHPVKNNWLLAAAMVVTNADAPYESCKLISFISEDAGENWQEYEHDYWGYDPWVAMMADGSAVLSWLGTEGSFNHEFPLNIFRSGDGGKTWNKSVQVFAGHGHGYDGTKLITNKTQFFLATVRFNAEMGADIVLYATEDQDKFVEAMVIPGMGRRLNFCEPAALSGGTLVIPAIISGSEINAHIYHPKHRNTSGPFVISENAKLGRGYARFVADTVDLSPFKDNLYFIRAVADGTSSQGVWINISTDQGKTWSKERRLDLFNERRISKSNVASVAVSRHGYLGVSWVDAQHGPDQLSYDVYFTLSRDGGRSFQRPVRITEVSSNPRTKENRDVANKFLGGGHYLGLTAKPDGSFQLLWSDSRHGIFQLQTCNVQIQAI